MEFINRVPATILLEAGKSIFQILSGLELEVLQHCGRDPLAQA